MTEAANTPEGMRLRAAACDEAAEKFGDVIIAMRELHPDDATLSALKIAIRSEQERLERRGETLRRRRAGMMAE